MNTEDQKQVKEIRELYRQMLIIQEANAPEGYIMPMSLYTEIMKKIVYLEESLKNARKSNETVRGIGKKTIEELERKRKYWENKYKSLKDKNDSN